MQQEPDHKRETKKVSLPFYIGSIIVILVVAIFGTVLGVQYFQEDTQESQGASVEDFFNSESENKPSTFVDFQPIEEMYSILMTRYLEEIDSEVLIEGALEGMADAIEDPYTEYLDEIESSSMDEDMQGSFEGIGAEVMKEGDYVRIVSPIAGSPAEEAGLLPNDYIVEVDGESVADLSINEAVQLIRGPQGSDVELLLLRGDNQFNVTLTRDSIPVESVIYEHDEDHPTIGHVHITTFNIPTYEELIEAIESLREEGVEKFIFDVRGNPGGLLDTALYVSNIFVADGEPLMQSQGRDEEPYIYYANSDEFGEYKFEGESVLLIDGGSASASEILAGAMSQSADIPLIGTPTFGKGTIQSVLPLSIDGEVKFTSGRWLTADGDWINEEGIQPDIEVEMPEYMNLLLINPEETYEMGDASEEVRNIKGILDALGYDVGEMNDVYNEQTAQAVEAFQNDRDIEVTGVVTGPTANEMITAIRDLIAENDTQYEAAIDYLLENN